MEHQILLYTEKGKTQEKLKLDVDLKKKDENAKAYSCAVRRLLQGWRQGTVKCKNRSEIAFSTKKPWKQKGTGRARAGSARSPLWRKGGVVFGPQARVRNLDINKKQANLVLNNLFFSALEKNNVCCLDFALEKDVPSTKMAAQAIKDIKTTGKKIILFLPFDDEINFASFRNIKNINVLSFDQPNAFDLSNGRWVFLKRDLDLFKNMVSKWN